MQHQTALEYLTSQIEEQRKVIEDHLVAGKLKDFAEYQRLCGVVQGLDYAKQLTNDLARKLENGDE